MKFILLRNIVIVAANVLVNNGCALIDATPTIVDLSFEKLELPSTAEEKKSIRVSRQATAFYDDGTSRNFPLHYHTVYRSADMDAAGNTVGMLKDIHGKNIKVSNRPDGTSVVLRSDKYYVITQFEESPGGVYAVALSKKKHEFIATQYLPVDFSKVGGTFINCAASKTPWGTHLTPEEDYNFDAYLFDPKTSDFNAQHINYCVVDRKGKLTGKYLAPDFLPKAEYSKLCERVKGMRDTFFAGVKGFTPYNYGFNLEVSLDVAGRPSIVNGRKHYVFGKASPEMALVMPDEKTVYIGNDSVFRPLLRLEADQPQDLSSGTLYIARWEQVSDVNGGSANLKWIKLGHATDSEVENYIKRELSFSDFFDVENPAQCPTEKGFKRLTVGEPGLMCIRLRDGSDGSEVSTKFHSIEELRQAAAFLETMKYGVWLGGSAEFNKGEGLAYNQDRNVLYFAISSIAKSMQDNYKDKESDNHIRLPANRCGGVFELSLGDNYLATSIRALVTGRPLKEGDEYANENSCHPNYIANPDNLRYIGHDTLIIGEDSTNHFNNMVFAYNLKSEKLTRIMTVPTGSEITGTFAPLITSDQTRLFVNIQHPLNDRFYNADRKSVNMPFLNRATGEEKRGYVGYIGGLPPLPLQ
ncbi:MAG: DUF839 domain-containing protein [Gammaproteobacteria bacterium]|nr:DUF839 domain-containing protein [Gammaproteobacteria bacterium]